MSEVLLKSISKKYGEVEAIKNVNLAIDDKEFIVLVGPSGCGKSTVLRMIAGLEDITSGDLFIGKNKVNNVEPKDRNIAMVFQSYALYPHKNVYENMAFGLKMRKFSKEEIEKRVKKAAEILHITEYLDRKPKQLSGGQRQRVALGRAIVRDPEVFLMDEPLSNLDAKLRVQMRSELIKLHSELQTTFIYVTHDQVEAMTMGDRIAIINDGTIQQVDKPSNIYNNPANMFVASFIGSPPMNFIEGKVDDNALFVTEKFSFKLNENLFEIVKSSNSLNKTIILGIRPEHIKITEKDSADFSINLDLIEMLGSESLLHFSVGARSVAAKAHPDSSFSAGDEVSFKIDLSKVVLFDITRGSRL
ncbi:MAG: ABC transporter ATP-binding protein [Vampirovibrionia bacterium]